MKTTFDVYSDSGHGWIKVPFSVLIELGIYEKISCFSYIRNNYAFLEEDCDASTLIGALKSRGIIPTFKEHTAGERRSKIRNYFCFHPAVVRNYISGQGDKNNQLAA